MQNFVNKVKVSTEGFEIPRKMLSIVNSGSYLPVGERPPSSLRVGQIEIP